MPAIFNRHTGYEETNPAENGFDITPSDANELSNVTRLLRVGGNAGTVKVDMVGSGQLTLNMAAGESLPLRVKKVYATGTTATGIQGFY